MTATVGPRDRRWVSARRATAAALHPDRGGDPEAFITAMADIDATYGHPTACGGGQDLPVIVIVAHPRWRRFIAVLRRAVHGAPGTRHFIRL